MFTAKRAAASHSFLLASIFCCAQVPCKVPCVVPCKPLVHGIFAYALVRGDNRPSLLFSNGAERLLCWWSVVEVVGPILMCRDMRLLHLVFCIQYLCHFYNIINRSTVETLITYRSGNKIFLCIMRMWKCIKTWVGDQLSPMQYGNLWHYNNMHYENFNCASDACAYAFINILYLIHTTNCTVLSMWAYWIHLKLLIPLLYNWKESFVH